jgi:transcriptional regulator with GAF, ATPase, and Fis domain
MPDEEPAAQPLSARQCCGRMVGRTPTMRRLFAQIEQVAASDRTVLIHGETGTGKELAAEALHELSGRGGPFIVVDCGAIPRSLVESQLFGHVRGAFTGAERDRAGAFEEANGGTIFLDEIGELPLDVQPKFLRVLESRSIRRLGGDEPLAVDVRVVAASLRDLAEEVRAKRFREDLFYRLSVVRLDLPPLIARMGDLPLLCDHLLRDMGAPPLGPAALKLLSDYHWPGNVRQLRNVLERAHALAGDGPLSIDRADLDHRSARASPSSLHELPYKAAKDVFTREYLEALLQRNRGNVSAAAREARLDRNWIIALARRLGVRVRD